MRETERAMTPRAAQQLGVWGLVFPILDFPLYVEHGTTKKI